MNDELSATDLPPGPLREAYILLNAVYVKTRRHGGALQTMQGLFMASRHASGHQGMALHGESGAGKTTTLRRFEESLRQQVGRADGEPSPLPIVTLSADTTPKSLLQILLAAHGDPVPENGALSVLEMRFKKFVPQRPDILGLGLDEAHHAFVSKTGRKKIQMAGTLKNIVSAFPKPIIILGPMDLEGYLDSADGLRMRFEQREFLEDLRLDLDDDLEDLREVLRAMDAVLPSEPGCSLASGAMLKRLYVAGRGSFGRKVSLVRRACAKGAIEGAARVGPSHYSAAWRVAAPRSKRRPSDDPFLLDIKTVTALAAQLNALLQKND